MTDPDPADKTPAPGNPGSTDGSETTSALEPAPAGGGMRVARLCVVLALCGGLLFFGWYAVNDLSKGLGPADASVPAETLALGGDDDVPLGGDITQARTAEEALGPQYIPIQHDPAMLPAYPGAERVVCVKLAGGERFGDEQARYIVADAEVDQVARHYLDAAEEAGFTLQTTGPLQGQPDGRGAQFARGGETLVVTIAPQHAAPPLAPSLSVVVQFRYPITSPPGPDAAPHSHAHPGTR